MKTIVVAILSMVSFAGAALAQVNYSAFQVSQQQLLEGVPQNLVQRFIDAATAIHERPTDINAQIELAAVCLDIANRSHYSFQWIHYAAKTLEQVLRQNPNNFMARHDYAMACFQEGDLNPAQPVMRLAITHFKKAIALTRKRISMPHCKSTRACAMNLRTKPERSPPSAHRSPR
jgi:hypothetical protein